MIGDESEVLADDLLAEIIDAVEIRIPDCRFGILFSGGIDSVLIAQILKRKGLEFKCYTASVSENSPDLLAAREVASILDLDLVEVIATNVEARLKDIVPLIEDSNVIKVGVGLTMFIAAERARADGVRVLYSGSGADEIFAGYNRYSMMDIADVNKDCFSDVLKIYERNTYRDDIVTMNNNIELRIPYLDRKLVEYSMRIPAVQKIKGGVEKHILREAAILAGVPKTLSFRKKKAAQYGSGVDKVIGTLAKGADLTKSGYLARFLGRNSLRLGAMISSGKDGLYAAHIMERQNYQISCFLTIASRNKESYMFHTPNVCLVRLQAESAGIPLIEWDTDGEKEKELEDLKVLLREAKMKYGIDGVVTGAIFSNYQRERVEKVCDEIGLKIFSPLWHMDQALEMTELLKRDFSVMFSSIQAYGLDKSWLAREITTADVDELKRLNERFGLNVAGEGGEFESLVLDCPLFSKKLQIDDYEIIEHDENTAFMNVKKASLVEKPI